DVQLDERVGQRAALDEGPAAHAASLFLAEDNDRAASRALHRLDRSDDAERTVELAALGTVSRWEPVQIPAASADRPTRFPASSTSTSTPASSSRRRRG